jgi:hypothetical protein
MYKTKYRGHASRETRETERALIREIKGRFQGPAIASAYYIKINARYRNPAKIAMWLLKNLPRIPDTYVITR